MWVAGWRQSSFTSLFPLKGKKRWERLGPVVELPVEVRKETLTRERNQG